MRKKSISNYSEIVEKSEVITHQFGDIPVPMIPHGGDLWVTGESIGGALEYPDAPRGVAKVYQRNKEELDNYSCVVKLTTQGKDGKPAQRRSVRVFNEEGIMVITMLSRQPKAREFRAWAVKILKSYRHGELVMSLPEKRDTLLETCLKETSKGNLPAMDILVNRYGFSETVKKDQVRMLAMMKGTDLKQLNLEGL